MGPYEIVAPLGTGGMGEVYRARDTRLDRTVAIKVLPEDLAGDAQFRQRFHAEARAISQLTHPNICTLHDIGEHEGTTFLVMELLVGETLADRLARGTPDSPALSLDAALQIGIQIADALAAAHQLGIIHRDLKPGNIMLTKAGPSQSAVPHAKLLDFGLAKATSAVVSSSLSMSPTTPPQAVTAPGAILGTIQYMAPEQIEGGVVDARSDIFAFGSVLYEMLTGRKAFEGKTQASVMAAILEREPPPVSALEPRAPALVEATVRKCLAKNPEERWQSAADLATAVRWALSGRFTVPRDTAPPNAVERGARGRIARIAATAALAAATFALGVGLTGRSTSSPRDRAPTMRFAIQPPPGARWSPSPISSAAQLALSVSSVTTIQGAKDVITHYWPQFLPDGRHVMYYQRSSNPEYQGVYVADLESQTTMRVLIRDGRAVHTPGHLLLVRDGMLFAQPFDDRQLEIIGESVRVADSVGHFGARLGMQP